MTDQGEYMPLLGNRLGGEAAVLSLRPAIRRGRRPARKPKAQGGPCRGRAQRQIKMVAHPPNWACEQVGSGGEVLP